MTRFTETPRQLLDEIERLRSMVASYCLTERELQAEIERLRLERNQLDAALRQLRKYFHSDENALF